MLALADHAIYYYSMGSNLSDDGQSMNKEQKLGCLFWTVVFLVPIIAVIWASLLPKKHSKKPLAIFVPIAWIGLGIILLSLSHQSENLKVNKQTREQSHEASELENSEAALQKDHNNEAVDNVTLRDRKTIWEERILVERRARNEACALYPHRLVDTIQARTRIILKNRTSLMPEYDPVEPLESIKSMKTILPGTEVIVVNFAVDKGRSLWYEVEVNSPGSRQTGWIYAAALVQQLPEGNFWNSLDHEEELRSKYLQELLSKYNLTEEQLNQISVEAFQSNWDLPPGNHATLRNTRPDTSDVSKAKRMAPKLHRGLRIPRDSLLRAIHSWNPEFDFVPLEQEEGLVGISGQTIISILGTGNDVLGVAIIVLVSSNTADMLASGIDLVMISDAIVDGSSVWIDQVVSEALANPKSQFERSRIFGNKIYQFAYGGQGERATIALTIQRNSD